MIRYWRTSCVVVWAAVLVVACGRVDPEQELAAAAASMTSRNYNEAAIRLNNVVQVEPDNIHARRLRGELALLLGDYAGASSELERARTLGAPLDSIALDLADALTSQRQPEGALTILDSVEASLGQDVRYATIRAEALLALGRLAEAEAVLELAEEAGGVARARVVRARVAFARNDLVSTERILSDALSGAPEEPLILVTRAELFARTDRLTAAAADLRRAADLYQATSQTPREVAALLALVQVQLAGNDLEAAEETAVRLTEKAPHAAMTAYMKGLVEYRHGRFDEATTILEPLVSARSGVVQFHALLGAVHLARGNFGQAEQQLQAALSIAPRDPAAIKMLAEVRLRQQRPDAALATLRPVADTATDDPQVGLLSGLASLLSGNTTQGLLYLEQAAALDPANELVKLELARAYLMVGRDADASALLEAAFGGGPADLEAGLLRLFAEIRLNTDAGAASELLEAFPRDSRALTAVAIYYQLRGDTNRARRLFEQAANLETSGATARLIMAATLVQEGRSQEAERLVAGVVEQQPDNPQALTALAELLMSRGAYSDAAELLGRAATQSGSIGPRLALAQLSIRRGDLVAARRDLDAAIAAAPDDPEVIAVSGVLALAERRTDEAVILLRRAEEALPNRLGVSLALARAELAREQPHEAREVVHRVLAAEPRSLPLRFVLGRAELMLGNASEALSIASDLKAEYPTQSAGYLLEAETNMAARRYAAAAEGFREAFEVDPTWPVLTRLLGALELTGARAEMLREIESWANVNPEHVPGLLALAGLLQDANRIEEAFRAYEKAISFDQANLIALNNAAWLAHELGRPDALSLAQRAFAAGPDNAAVLDTLGWILLAQDRETEAIGHLSRAAELASGSPEIRYHLARALAAGGRPSDARATLRQLVESGIEFEQREEAQRLLESL